MTLILTTLISVGILNYVSQPILTFTGSLYYNDSGESHGGFEGAMQWNVTMKVQAGNGLLIVTPEPGYLNNNRLQKWSYGITGLQITSDLIVMAIDGYFIALEFVENDTVWNSYDNHYIAYTPDLIPTIFPGFLHHYYVELRLAIK